MSKLLNHLLLPILVLSLLILSCTPAVSTGNSPGPTPTATSSNQDSSNLSELPSFSAIIRQVQPAVVFISSEYLETSFFFREIRVKSGSGVLLSPDGYILTNYHVIEDEQKTEVMLPGDEQTYRAEVIGTDPLSDLAVIKIEGKDFPSLKFGDPSRLQIGDWVMAIGNALGLVEGGPTVTVGIVSNLDRSFPPTSQDESAFYDVIQTDAAINPGNSGGPLVNLKGEVVGINTFIISGAQNIGFAVGAGTAQRVYNDLVEHGKVMRPYIGASFMEVTPAVASELDLHKNRGVLVAYLEPGGPAARAGLREEDVITEFEGRAVSQPGQLVKLVWQYNVGDAVQVTYWRGTLESKTTITLGERP
ncbi:MAG: trypsin-like peptidase domain-containing protein [Dehalococcoidia bacterium]|nr:trypsin-like peptidase domain-containing protein [Dehalococcoidia bacterium]